MNRPIPHHKADFGLSLALGLVAVALLLIKVLA